MPQSTYTATALAVGIRSHTALVTFPANGLVDLQRHEGLLHASQPTHAKRAKRSITPERLSHDHPHRITASPQPQTARDSTPLVAQLTWFNRCKMVALHTLNCRKPTVANAKFNLHSISTMWHMAVEGPQIVTRSGGGHGHLTGQSGRTGRNTVALLRFKRTAYTDADSN